MKKDDFWGIVLVIIACLMSFYVGYYNGLNKNVDYLIYKDLIKPNINHSIDN